MVRPVPGLRRVQHDGRGADGPGGSARPARPFTGAGAPGRSGSTKCPRVARSGSGPVSPSSTGCSAAASWQARSSSSAATRESGSPRCCSRPASALAEVAGPVLYVSGEESAAQMKLRADRLGVRRQGPLHPPRDRGRGDRGADRARSPRGRSWSTRSRPSTSRTSSRRRAASSQVRECGRTPHDARQDARDRRSS